MNKYGVFLFVFLGFFLLSASKGWSQPLSKIKDEAQKLYERGKYREALVLLNDYTAQKNNDFAVLQMQGIAAYHANKLPLAKQSLQAVVENGKNVDPSVYFYLARIFHADLNFKEATRFYKKYLGLAKTDNPKRRAIVADIKRCAAGLKIERQADLALVENLGEWVNSLHDEFAPVQSPNFEEKIYFSAAREDAEGGLRNDAGIVDVKNGHYFHDIYATYVDNDDWVTPERLPNALINTSRNEHLLDFANQGKTMIFFRSMNNFSGDIYVDTFKTQDETRSLPPQFNGPMLAQNGESTLHLFNDSMLVFSGRRTSGYGGADLYFSVLREGAWTNPQNLGPTVNSNFDEITPFLARDGRTLYFSSNCLNSMGGFDVFKTSFDPDSLRWTTPVNLGKPINSSEDDTHFRLTVDGMKGFFSSNRKDSYGARDLYLALFKKFQSEQTPAIPVAFHLIEEYKNNNPQLVQKATKAKEVTNYAFSPIFYDNDDDLLRGGNTRELRNALIILKNNPEVKMGILAHCSEGEKATFDLYMTMKRVEKIAKFLLDNGVESERILLKSVGSEYPIALTILDGEPNPAGEKLNRHVEFRFYNLDSTSVNITYESAKVSPFMVSNAGKRLTDLHEKGLSYKVQIVVTKRIYDNEALRKYGDAMMEAVATEGVYQYTVGLFGTYNEANQLRSQMVKDGFRDAFVVPYVKGLRVSGEEVKKYTTQYPDLNNYINGRRR